MPKTKPAAPKQPAANRGGRPRVPTKCAKCGAECDSARKAQAHC